MAKRLHVLISDELHDKLERLAEERRQDKTALVEEALRLLIEQKDPIVDRVLKELETKAQKLQARDLRKHVELRLINVRLQAENEALQRRQEELLSNIAELELKQKRLEAEVDYYQVLADLQDYLRTFKEEKVEQALQRLKAVEAKLEEASMLAKIKMKVKK